MQKRKTVLYALLVLILALSAGFIYTFRLQIGKIISPFLWAVPIAYIVKPLADKLERRKIPRCPAILAVYLFFILAFAALAVFFIPELVNNTKELMNTLPEMVSRYQKMLNDFIAALKSSKWSDDIKQLIYSEMQDGITAAQKFASEALKKALETVINTAKIIIDLTIAMVIAYYYVKDSKQFGDFFLALVPRRYRNTFQSMGKEISFILAGFIQGQLLTALIVGAMETAGLLLVGVKYPLVLGFIGGIANIIPYFGPFLGAIPAVAVALTDSPIKFLWTVLVFVVVQQIDNSYISPKIIEGKLGLHPVATILAVLVGGEFFGIMGMLLAVPVFAILRVIVRKAVDAIAS